MEKICPECGSTDIGMVTDTVGICKSCLSRVEFQKEPEIPTCPECGSTDLGMVTDTVGICKNCLSRVEFNKTATTPITQEAETETDFDEATEDETDEDTEGVELLAISCPACGSNDVDMMDEETGFCNHCNSQVIINKPKPTTNVVNNVTIHTNSSNPSSLITSYAVKSEMNAFDFTRRAFITLAKNKDTPQDIFDAEFSTPTREFRQFAEVACDVNVSYSVNIGTDHKEQYQEYNSYKAQYETKTKTVTTWRPVTGVYNASKSYHKALDGGGYNHFGSTCDFLKKYSPKQIVYAENADFETEAPLLPSQGDIDEGKETCIDWVKKEAYSSIKGDHKKDFNASGIATISAVNTYVIPQYKMKYKYNGETGELRSFGTKFNYDWGDIPNAKKEIGSEIDKKCSLFTFISFAALVLSCILSLSVKNLSVIIPFFIISAVLFVASEIYRHNVTKNVYEEHCIVKIAKLQALLSKKHLKALSNEEINEIKEGNK